MKQLNNLVSVLINFFPLVIFLTLICLPLLNPLPAFAFEYILEIPAGTKDFPIKDPVDGDNYCYGGSLSKQWEILQWNNSQSLCGGSTTSSNCPGADFIRETPTMRICYWDSNKKFQLKSNVEFQPYNGCQPNVGGGYNLFVSLNPTNVYDPSWPFLRDVAKVNISAKIENKEFKKYGSCPPGQTWTEAAFFFMGVIVTNYTSGSPNYGHSIFYQLAAYDNRGPSAVPYAECAFTKDWSFFADPVTNYGDQQWAEIGSGEKSYEIDVLPRIKEILKQCRPTANLDEYKVGNLYVGNELSGRTELLSYLTDPKLVLVPKSQLRCSLTVNGLTQLPEENGLRAYQVEPKKVISNALDVSGTKNGVSFPLNLELWRSPVSPCNPTGCWYGQSAQWLPACCGTNFLTETFFTNKAQNNVTTLISGINTTNTINVPLGKYYLVCNAADPTTNTICTGNPFPGAITPPWQDCGGNSRIIVEVKEGSASPSPTPTPTPSPSLSLSLGWNQITWPNVSGKKASDVPPECPMAVTQENFWFRPYVKNYGGVIFNFETGKSYYLRCSQSFVWSP